MDGGFGASCVQLTAQPTVTFCSSRVDRPLKSDLTNFRQCFAEIQVSNLPLTRLGKQPRAFVGIVTDGGSIQKTPLFVSRSLSPRWVHKIHLYAECHSLPAFTKWKSRNVRDNDKIEFVVYDRTMGLKEKLGSAECYASQFLRNGSSGDFEPLQYSIFLSIAVVESTFYLNSAKQGSPVMASTPAIRLLYETDAHHAAADIMAVSTAPEVDGPSSVLHVLESVEPFKDLFDQLSAVHALNSSYGLP